MEARGPEVGPVTISFFLSKMIIVYNFELFAVEARGSEVGPVQPLAGGPGAGLAARQNRLTLPGTALKGTVPRDF